MMPQVFGHALLSLPRLLNPPPALIMSAEPSACRAGVSNDFSDHQKYSIRHRHRPWVIHQRLVALSFFGDLMVVLTALFVSYFLRFETGLASIGVVHPGLTHQSYIGHVVLGGIVMMGLLANFRIQDPRNFLAFRSTVKIIFRSCALWFVVFMSLALMLKIDPSISRVYCLVAMFVAMGYLVVWRWVFYCLVRGSSLGDTLRQKTVFVGWDEGCDVAVERFKGGRGQQLNVLGVVRPQGGVFETEPPEDIPVLGDLNKLRTVIREEAADLVMVVDGATDRTGMLELAETCGREFVDFKLVPNCFQVLVSGLKLESINGMPVLGVGKLPLHHVFNNLVKRALDMMGALVGLVVFAPIMALFGLLVRLESRGPVIYRQVRIGRNGRPFSILKIRSMKLDAEVDGSAGWTVENDPRCLRVGAFMRKWNIDELPQFWNVLMGHMSLVGPRPERPELIDGFKEEIPHYNLRHNVKPGVTGWAQINGLRGDTCLKERVRFDLAYMENWNILLDLQIMFLTFFKRKGAC
jgi:exopolysaccharide biosynthesis polyprenyl glycosylphosphotransferase